MPIEAEGLFTLSDVWRGTRFVWRKVLAIYSVLGLMIIAGAGVLIWHDEAKWKEQLPWIAVGLFVIAYFWIFAFYRSYRTKRGSPVLQGLVRYQFDDDGIRLVTPHSQADVKWPAFIKWTEGKYTLLTYQTPKIGNMIPKRFFQSPADVDAVRALMRTHIRAMKK
jgi:YcxB-like protein